MSAPAASRPTAASHAWQRLLQECPDAEIAAFFESVAGGAPGRDLLDLVFACSPYLTRLIGQYPAFVKHLLEIGCDKAAGEWRASLPPESDFTEDAPLMKALRQHKAKGALLIALADLSGAWNLAQVTEELTSLAERTLGYVFRYLWHRLEQRGEIQPSLFPCQGLIALGMGKLGARELNYSSDIDLVLLYEPDQIHYQGRQSLQHCLNRFSQDLVRLMQERTAEGYVFRTDLRLRPDPGSTAPVVNRDAAMFYYETVGQNWERAAFIKGRPVAGDLPAGQRFITELKPFLWRRSLDFAAIADIQSIKRQMDNRRIDELELPGHDIKRGLGGIREIEFIAQINQLIWGGRKPSLRLRGTCEVLRRLAEENLLEEVTVATLIRHYETLRRVEHRIQMMEDQQTHSLPSQNTERTQLATLCGHSSLKRFDPWMESTLREVHEIYRHCFASEPSLADEGNLSFTGVDLDAGTLQTLQKLGFHDAERVAQAIANWHRGTIRSMRSARARELLTELTPNLLRALGETADPDTAFTHFTRFLERLPAVVQLFSLLQSNPQILRQLAVIMGNAPSLAAHLGRHPDWFDILLTAQYHNILAQPPSPGDYLQYQDHEEEWIGALCRFRNEREFLIGTEILMGKLDPLAGNRLLTATADAALTTLARAVRRRFEQSHGTIAGSGMAILALGRYGSHDLTFGSDLDLIFLYDVKNDQAVSNGEKSHTATVYYNRLAQRLVGGLEAQTPEGRLYAIDTRLRPGGKDSLLATSLAAFEKYFTESAWSFEKMALLRHRIIYADAAVKKKLTKALEAIYRQPVDATAFRRDVAEMRERIAREHPPTDTWRTKYARGGLIDLVFLAQSVAICTSCDGGTPPYPPAIAASPCSDGSPKDTIQDTLLQPSVPGILRAAGERGLLPPEDAKILINAWDFQLRLSCLLRLCKRDFTEETAPRGLLAFLARSFDAPDYTQLKQRLLEHQQSVQSLFNHYVKGEPRP